tara:strand:- start:984 stop:1382 length:399 start_codon:yes stop_codon:yes gene_type:complete
MKSITLISFAFISFLFAQDNPTEIVTKRKSENQQRLKFEIEQKKNKRAEFIKKYGERFLVNFDNKTIMPGFTRAMVIDILGYPTIEKRNKSVAELKHNLIPKHLNVEMVYRNANHKYKYVYITNDIVTSFQE